MNSDDAPYLTPLMYQKKSCKLSHTLETVVEKFAHIVLQIGVFERPSVHVARHHHRGILPHRSFDQQSIVILSQYKLVPKRTWPHRHHRSIDIPHQRESLRQR